MRHFGVPSGLTTESPCSVKGAVNSPAAVYSLVKYRDWLKQYAPPEAAGMTFSEAGPVPGQGHIAQQIFWYTAFTETMTGPDLAVTDEAGNPLWRMAPSPHGAYWSEGMKLGYQDCGAWTFLKSTPLERRKAAWLYAQFTVCKSTSLKKFMVGLTPIRESDLNSSEVSERAPQLGGLIEFYRSPARVLWTPTGTNVPDYPKLAQLWWQNVSLAVTGEVTAQAALDKLAREMDAVLARLERAGMDNCAPVLNEEQPAETWFAKPGAPKPALADEKPQGRTVPYAKLLESWQ